MYFSAYLRDEEISFLVNSFEIEDLSSDDELADTTWVPTKRAKLGESSSESSEDEDDSEINTVSNSDVPIPACGPSCIALQSNQSQQNGKLPQSSTRRHIWRKRPFPSKNLRSSVQQVRIFKIL